MPVRAHHARELGEHVHLGLPHAGDRRELAQRSGALLAGRTHAIELPRALGCACGPDRGHRVREPPAREQGGVAQVARRRQDVELEPDRRARAEPEPGERRLEPAQARQRLDRLERALRTRPREVAPDEQQGLAVHGNDEMRVLRRAGEVVDVGRDDEQRGVEPGLRKAVTKSGETRLELGARRGLRQVIGGHYLRS